MTPPRIAYVPHFVALIDVGFTRFEVAVYGAIAAFQAAGHEPRVDEIAWAAARKDKRHARRALAELQRRHMIRRSRRGRRWKFELLGPTLSTQQGENGA